MEIAARLVLARMTPRHLSMFCVTQIGAIVLGCLFSLKCKRMIVQVGIIEKVPAVTAFVANWGWYLLLVPIWCVLVIPRHKEDEDAESTAWSRHAPVAVCFGVAAIFLPVSGAALGFLNLFFGPRF